MPAEHSRHVLVVDDSIEYLHFMEMLLSGEGFSVATVSSLDSVAGCVATRRPDLVITDVRMPGLAPFAAVQFLRSDEATASIPVLICTGAANELREFGEQIPSQNIEVLMKPFDVDALLLKVSALLPDVPRVVSA